MLSSATMASSLPFEILSIIAQYAAGQGGKLTPCAMVNRDWQAAFEEQIYSSLVVLSPSEYTNILVADGGESHEKHGLTIQRLDELVTGPESWKPARKATIKRILYKVAVPHWLSEEILRDPDNEYGEFTYDNAFRRENDEAFSEGVPPLFDYLSHWTDKARPIRLDVALQAEIVYASGECTEPGAMIGFYEHEGDEQVAPYRASFIGDCQLPIVNCISALDFPNASLPDQFGSENEISPGAALKIASACRGDALSTVYIEGAYGLLHFDLALSTEMRKTVAENLYHLPPSVSALDIQWSFYGHWHEVHTAPSPLPAVPLQPDALSAALHNVSLQLKELYVQSMDILPEFFCPTGIGLPTGQNWEHLEILHFSSLRFYTPLGHVLRYDPRADGIPTHHQSYFDEFYNSIGLAVRRMPKLKELAIDFDRQEQMLRFRRLDGGGRYLWVRVLGSYRFSREVGRTWNLHKAQTKETNFNELKATWTTWPPC
jgi:hypothetical protein